MVELVGVDIIPTPYMQMHTSLACTVEPGCSTDVKTILLLLESDDKIFP